MTTEQKAKAYDKAIEKIKYVMEHGVSPVLNKEDLQDIFPELKESEDERIRKDIISFLRSKNGYMNPNEDWDFHNRWLPWLEKQGDKDTFIKEELECIKGYRENAIKRLKELEKQGQQSICNIPSKEIILAIWDLGNEWKELTNGSISTEYGTQLEYIQKHWNESEYYLREKQGEQKPIDKAEPKFRNGQWIVWQDKCYKVNYNGCGYELIDQNGLRTSLEYGTVEENAHVWDITRDAKDGDVLAYNDGSLTIFRYRLSGLDAGLYMSHFLLTDKIELKQTCAISNVHPATKEQRDLLFKKMREEGYEWDAEKKELRMIERQAPKPKWTEEDKQNLDMALDYIYDDYLRNWLKQKIEEQ